tara:strand:- start:1338 stop:1553 length:216 start_codon:yes stop_codon:yes gene_type:complete
MLNMSRIKKTRPVRSKPDDARKRFIGLRLRESDVAKLELMANEQDVGISTFARLIIESYVADHGPSKRRKR